MRFEEWVKTGLRITRVPQYGTTGRDTERQAEIFTHALTHPHPRSLNLGDPRESLILYCYTGVSMSDKNYYVNSHVYARYYYVFIYFNQPAC